MSIKDTTPLNARYATCGTTSDKQEEAAAVLLTQLAKVEAREVQAMVVAILNKDGTNNLVGLAGSLYDASECAFQILARLEQIAGQPPRKDGLAIDPEALKP